VIRLTLLGALFLLPSCAVPGARPDAAPSEDRLLTLRAYLSGSFSSEDQAARDGSYYHITLHTTPMWTWRDDGPWLYVEQAVTETPDRPYRQRVYKLERTGDGRFWSRVFVIPHAASYAGAWKSGSPLSEVSPSHLEERVGCAITLEWDDERKVFVGSTSGTGCPSDLAGAAYATSTVTLEPDRMLTWDRGYDATGQQVWGATEGGYEFLRVN
jgi:CpeT protein